MTMYWNSETTRHVVASNAPSGRGIERASGYEDRVDPERAAMDEFNRNAPASEMRSWSELSPEEQDEYYEQAGVTREASGPAVTPNSQAPRIGDEYDESTVPVEKPEEDGTLKAYLAKLERFAADENWDPVDNGTWVLNEGDRAGRVEDDGGYGWYWSVKDEEGFGDTIDDGRADDFEGACAAAERVLRQGSRRTAARKTASLWDEIREPRHKVAGWNWDEVLNGYVAEGAADFACICGSNVTAPGQVVCACGKLWNSYTISHEGATRLVCREIPVRKDVVLASRQEEE